MAIKRFLVVDHNEEATKQVKSILGELRMQDVTISSDSAEALTLVGPKRIEFIIVNWELQPLSGLAFVQRVRADAASSSIPFLIYSERLKGEEVKLLQDMGISNVVPFPLDKELVANAVRSIMERENALDPVVKELRTVTAMVAAGQHKEALERLLPCTANEKLKDVSYTLKGDIESQQKSFKEAEKSLGVALKKNPHNRGTQQVMAKVYSQTGRHKEAIDVLLKLCETSPLNMSNMLNLGGAFVTADRPDEAKQVLAKANAVDPSHPVVKDLRGTIAFKEGDFALAKELLQATPNGDEMCRTMNNIGVGLVAKGEFPRAIASYLQAIEILQGKELSHFLKYNLGLAYKKANQLPEAFKALGESILEKPDYQKAVESFNHLVQLMKAQKIPMDQALLDQVNACSKSAA